MMSDVLLQPEEDVENRLPVWDALQMLFMDTDPEGDLNFMARTCAESPYSIQSLELILFQEMLPALRGNLMQTIGEWRGYETESLKALILEKHRFGKGRPLLFRRYAQGWWDRLRPLVEAERLDGTNT